MMSNHSLIQGAVGAMTPMTTNELWVRLRRLFRNQTPSREIERIVSGFRPDERRGGNRSAGRRERLDLNRGWVNEDEEPGLSDVRAQKRRSGAAGGKER